MSNNLFILLGPSGSGKTELVKVITGEHPFIKDCQVAHLKRIITSTTREPRHREKDGRDYYFRTQQQFEQEWTAGKLLERADYKGTSYGLRESDATRVLKEGDGIIILEPQGAREILKWKPDTHLVHILPLAEEELRMRMLLRGSGEEQIRERLHDLPGEYDAINALVRAHVPHCVNAIDNNGTLAEGALQLKDYIESKR